MTWRGLGIFAAIIFGFLNGLAMSGMVHANDFKLGYDLGYWKGAHTVADKWAGVTKAQHALLNEGGLCAYADSACGYYHNPHPDPKYARTQGYSPKHIAQEIASR